LVALPHGPLHIRRDKADLLKTRLARIDDWCRIRVYLEPVKA
jgi:hypothetical protein